MGTCSPQQRSAAASDPACPHAVDLSCHGVEAAGDSGGGGVHHRDVQVLDVGTEGVHHLQGDVDDCADAVGEERGKLLVATVSLR